MRGRILIAAGLLVLGSAPAAWAQSLAPQAAPAPVSAAALRADDRTSGSPDAPVTLTVYLSTTCGHCAHWRTGEFPAIKARWVDTGQVRVVYRDLTTAPQDVAASGAQIARCVPADRYDAALDTLFRGQRFYLPQGMVSGWLASAGAAGGLTGAEIQSCLADDAGRAEVQSRVEQAWNDGVRSTPTFLVNGREVLADSDSHGVDAFAPILDPLLAGR